MDSIETIRNIISAIDKVWVIFLFVWGCVTYSYIGRNYPHMLKYLLKTTVIITTVFVLFLIIIDKFCCL